MPASLTVERARALVSRLRQASVLVVGDLMLDQFVVGRVTRISPEAPVPVVAFEREENRLGGAANVAANARALGASVTVGGLVGEDASGDCLLDLLRGGGIATAAVVRAPARRTTRKVRLVTTRNQQVARVDYEDDRELEEAEERALLERVQALERSAAVLIVSDYQKGVVTRGVVEHLAATWPPTGRPLVIDPKVPHVARYRGATLITPNHHEAEAATAVRIRTDADASVAARRFRELAGCQSVLITRGEHGMWLLDGSGPAGSAPRETSIASTAREVADVTGAGDTVVATLALALAAGATLSEAAVLANFAAGISVGKFGPAAVSPDELLSAVSGGSDGAR
jgi:D-beta-D-heptose 7-phosphate kinase/D-beta-D-heptose 1-phosphate adenosyltransferase